MSRYRALYECRIFKLQSEVDGTPSIPQFLAFLIRAIYYLPLTKRLKKVRCLLEDFHANVGLYVAH